ncbi:hypothetical protein BOW53_16550 [Solemya pervernicosa gill symbiont]|uniref:Solute-binding protein family 3/N-terminal domain-containing protein n=2 Tax=Gammaproteobacteria incertae sedis TaxID=118884 RepID=A0A1T2KZB0_9GAMM|nr:hypothetical protein BOW53_16550 [Solemya pervernicosa gill symbiont]
MTMHKLRSFYLSVLLLITPFGYAQQTLVFSGIEGSVNTDISLQVLEEAYQKLGITVEYRPLPGERALRTADTGRVDGEVFRIANVEKRYTNLIPVPTAINVLQGIAFSKVEQIPISGWESLKRYHLGIQIGIKFAERGTEGMQRTLVETNEQLFKMLDAERVEVVIAAHANGLKTLSDIEIDSVHALKPAIQEYQLYHYLHKRHASLVPKLDQVLQQMQQSGRISAIRKQALLKLENGH